MGREIKVVCDSCGKDVYHQSYATLKIRKVIHGKQQLFPTIWLCAECYRKTKLQLVLADLTEEEAETKEGED